MMQIYRRNPRISGLSRLYEKIVCPALIFLLSTLLLPNLAIAASISFAVDATLSADELSDTKQIIRAVAKNLAQGTTVSLVVFDRVYQNGVPMAAVDEKQLEQIDSVLDRVEYSETSNIATGIEKAFSDVDGLEQAQIILFGNAAITLEDTDKVEKFTQWLNLVLLPKMQAGDVTLTTVDIDRENDPAIEEILKREEFAQLLSPAEAEQTAKKISMILPTDVVSEEQVVLALKESLDTVAEGEDTAETNSSQVKEPADQEPVVEDPVVQQNVAEEPADLQPTAEQPALEELANQDTVSAENDTQETTEPPPVTEEPALLEPAAEEKNYIPVLLALIAFSVLAIAAIFIFLFMRRNKKTDKKTADDNKTIQRDPGRYFSADESAFSTGLFSKEPINPDDETRRNTQAAKGTVNKEATDDLSTVARNPQKELKSNQDDTQPRVAAVAEKTSTEGASNNRTESSPLTSDTSDLDELRTITRIKHKGNNIE